MGDDTQSVSNQHTEEDSLVDNENLSQSEEDVDDAIENLDVGCNYEYNSQDMEIVPVFLVQENQAIL